MNGRNWLIAGGALGVLLGVPKVRRATLSKGIMNGMKSLGFLPKISETEKTAIEAGTGANAHWSAGVLKGLGVLLQSIFVIGLRVLGQKMR